MKNNLKINCPTCGQKVLWCAQSVSKPFCSERCKLIDLGEWAKESRVIPGEPIPEEFSEEAHGSSHSLDEE